MIVVEYVSIALAVLAVATRVVMLLPRPRKALRKQAAA